MRRIFTFFLTFLLGMFVTALYAQTHTVSGTVIDKDANEPLIGANVLIKGTTIGTVTDLDGKYTLQAGDKDILVFSYLSMKTIEEPVNGRTVINVKMTSDTETLGEVVVTAMGIKRQSETLTYSAQTVGGKDVNDIKSVNMINSLQGKSAGMMITPNSTGAGGSSKILFRGNKSISGNNQPLVVVDGVPVMMNITNSQVDSNYGGQRDGGDAMSTINPDDIAQITLLKGASAAALYGAVAANGAIMITTKSAQSGKVSVNVSSNTTMESPMVLPEFQTTYGMSDNGTFSWGEKLSSKAPNYAKKFFRTGFTTNNSISLSGGNENIQSYFSYANVYSQGITPQNDYRSHNLNSKVGFNILKDIHIDFTAKFTNQHITNQAAAGYLWNPLTGVYLFPRGEDWNGYKENFEVYDPARGCYVQNWTNTQQQQFGNPYWMLNRQTPITDRNRYEFGGSIKWNITPDLNIQGRMRYERGEEHWVHNAYASSVGNLYPMGRMKDNRYFSDQLYGDVLVSYNHTFNDFSLSATAGSSFTKTKTSHVDLWGEGSQFSQPGSGNIFYPNIFTPNNYYGNMSTVGKDDNWMTQKRLNSVFATAQLGYREGIFLDISARNDWSSTLANTESMKNGFFYPSVGLTWIMSNSIKLPEWINFSKFRGSFAQVGNDLPIGITNLADIIQCGGSIQTNDIEQRGDLKPEISTSIEFGTEWKFFNNRFGIDFTWYRTDTKNQLLKVANPAGSLYAFRYINAGKIRNTGIELTIEGTPLMNENFRWKTAVNMSMNRNKVVSLHKDYKSFRYGSEGFSMAYDMWVKEGGKLGDIYGNGFERDENGKIKLNETGNPIKVTGNNTLLGNANPDALLGWSNTFTYKGFTLYFLIDARIGGDVMSLTQAHLDAMGVSKESGESRDRGYVEYEGIQFKDVPNFYGTVGGRNGISEYYMYDATNVRLRELTLGYSFPETLLAKTKFIKGLDLTLVARNLFFLYKDAPFDPDATLSVGNTLQGVDVFGMPTTRNIGFNVKFTF